MKGRDQIKYSELEKMLRKSGCSVYKEGAGHTLWYSPMTGKIFPVGRHKTEDVKPGTLQSILRDAGLK